MADANELPVEQIESKEPIADGGKEPNLPTETVDWKSKYEQDIKEREAKLSEYDQRMRDKDRYVNEQQKQLEAYKKYESVLQRLQADQEKRNQVERQSKIQRGDFSPVVDEAVSKTQAALAEKLAQVDQYIQMTQRQQMEAQVKAEETELMAGLQSTFSDQDRKTIGPFVSDFLKNVWQTQGVEKFKEWAKDPMTLKRIGRDMYIESQQKQQAQLSETRKQNALKHRETMSPTTRNGISSDSLDSNSEYRQMSVAELEKRYIAAGGRKYNIK